MKLNRLLLATCSVAALSQIPLLAFALSGQVYRDRARNNLFDTLVDTGIANLTVNFYNAASASTPCASTTTDSSGNYNLAADTINTSCGSPTTVRVEVVGLALGSNNAQASNVRFEIPSATGVNIPLSGGQDFCAQYSDGNETTLDTIPSLTSNQLISGLTTGGANTGTRTAFRAPYNASGITGTITTLGTHGTTGPTYGVAHQRSRDRAFYSAFQRRRAAFIVSGGQDGTGKIFYVDNATTCTTCTVQSVDLDTLTASATTTGTSTHTTGSENFGAVGTASTNIAVDQGAYTNSTAADPENPYSQVGKIGFGDIDVSPDQRRLYAINLQDRSLYALDITGSGAPTLIDLNGAAAGSGVAVPAPTGGCTNGVARPFAIGIADNRVYVGGVCTGETGGSAADVDAYVMQFDVAAGTFSQELRIDLNYERGCADYPTGTTYTGGTGFPAADCKSRIAGSIPAAFNLDGARARWNPWTDKIPVDRPSTTHPNGTGWPSGYRTSGSVTHPQPMLSDIEFVNNGDMVLAFRDRFADQISNGDWGPEASLRRNEEGVAAGGTPNFANGQYTGFPAGDLLRVGRNSGGAWALESNGGLSGGSFSASPSGQNNGEGPGTCTVTTTGTCGEHFFGDNTMRSINAAAAVRPSNAAVAGCSGSDDTSGFQNHEETSYGGLAVLPTATSPALGADPCVVPARAAESGTESTELVYTSEDPITFNSGGFTWLRTAGTNSGGRVDDFQVYENAAGGLAAKSNGLGDVELMCNSQPLVIGNRLWADTDFDGAQDPGESGIANVSLEIRDATTGAVLGQTTTDVNGLWSFTLANRISATADVTTDNVVRRNQPYNTSYYVTIVASEFLAGGDLVNFPTISPVNVGAGAQGSGPDARDSDSSQLTVPTLGSAVGVLVAVGSPGGDDQSIDFGFAGLDLGDLPDGGAGTAAGNYQTLVSDSGPSNTVVANLRLGASVGSSGYDRDRDGQPSAQADGDNTNADNDENGPTFAGVRAGAAPTIPMTVFNNTGGIRNLCGFIDFNNDGDFLDADESASNTVPNSGSVQSINLVFTGSVPVAQSYSSNRLYSRFRVQSAACSSTGFGGEGEVEDFALPVVNVSIAMSAIPSYCPGQGVTYTITYSNTSADAVSGYPVTADLIGSNEPGLAGIPIFAVANWAVSSVTNSGSLVTSSGTGDINTTASLPANSSVTITVQGTFTNDTVGSQVASADINPGPGFVDTSANDLTSATATQNPAATCAVQITGTGSQCPNLGNSGTGALNPVAFTCSAASPQTLNTYYPSVETANGGSRCVRVGTSTGATTQIAVGDVLLIVQMQGATIDPSISNVYGDGVAGSPGGALTASAGQFEYAIAQSAVQTTGAGVCAGLSNVVQVSGAGSQVGQSHGLRFTYTHSPATAQRQVFQIIRVPVHTNVNFTNASCSIAAAPWNGSTGGIVALDATQTVNLSGGAGFTAANVGFRGGVCATSTTSNGTAVFASAASAEVSGKAEGFAGTTTAIQAGTGGYTNGNFGLGAPGNGGGGGQFCATNQTTGGGGGGGRSAGGTGGTDTCTNIGHAGGVLPASNDASRLLLGGGGGAGATNGTCSGSAGRGGGVVLLRALELTGNGTINASGQAATGTAANNVATGGGGGGGTIVLMTSIAGANNYAGITFNAAGGNATAGTAANAAGGGGGGGNLYRSPLANGISAGTVTVNGGTVSGSGTAGSGSTAVTNIDPVNSSPGVKPAYICAQSSTVPVTLASVQVSRNAGELVVDFTTASEAGTVGYRVLTELGVAASGVPNALLNQELTPARGDGFVEQRYQIRGRDFGVQQIWIEELATDGAHQVYGPYAVGTLTGERNVSSPVNWAAVQAQQAAFRQAQQAALRANRSSDSQAEIRVSKPSFLSVSHEQLLAQGVDLSGRSAAQIRVSRGANSVPFSLSSSVMGPGSTLGFYADGVQESLYTQEAVYRVGVGAGSEMPAESFGAVTQLGEQVSQYVEKIAPNKLYSFSSPLADPWFMARAVRSGATTGVLEAPFDLPHRSMDSRVESISVSIWGGLDYANPLDHSVVIKLNGQELGRKRFDGVSAHTLRYPLPSGLLRTGSNVLSIELPNETGEAADIVNLEGFEISYLRQHQLDQNALSVVLSHSSDTLLADGFELGSRSTSIVDTTLLFTGASAPVVAMLEGSAGQTRILSTEQSGTEVRVRVKAASGSRLSILPQSVPTLAPAAPAMDPVGNQAADLLVLAHPSLIEGLGAFVSSKQAEGLRVKVVDVESIYRAYSAGVIDPFAIKLALRDAQQRLGIRSVLLVGGDSYDYADNLRLGSLSMIPTHYRRISPIIAYAPADSVFADTNDDGLADLALGRWPVRTLQELSVVVSKSLQFSSPSTNRRALFLSDRALGADNFRQSLAEVAPLLGSEWSAQLLSLDEVAQGSASELRHQVVQALQAGVRVLSYYGHSAPASWSREGLVTATQVNGGLFAQVNEPPAVLQLGCWATYFVDPTRNTIAHGMLTQTGGASAILGASSLTATTADLRFARELLPRVGANEALGEALRNVQRALSTNGSDARDIVIGGTLLGDPTLKASQ